MLATLLASLVLCTGTTLARLAFSSPTADTVCIGNVTCTISWREDTFYESLIDYGSIKMGIYVGSVTQQTLVQDLGVIDNPAETTSINATIDPLAGPAGNFYFIRAQSSDIIDPTTRNLLAAFSARFKSDGMKGQMPTGVNELVPLPSPSAADFPSGPPLTVSLPTSSAGSTPLTTSSATPSTSPRSSVTPVVNSSASSIFVHVGTLVVLVAAHIIA